jgi:ribosomal protein S18 acetylase RimI-like enzyme
MNQSARASSTVLEPARWPDEVPLARELFLEYAGWLDFDLCFQGFDQELAGLPGGYAPPDGGLWFARASAAVAGVVGLRPFGDDGRREAVCEMKRLWVRPAYRGLGLGRRLAERTIVAARAAGYRRMRLDTLERMTEARALYRDFGFRDVTAEVANPHPELIYMELELDAARLAGEGMP